jgi:Tol biopolymer transport system component
MPDVKQLLEHAMETATRASQPTDDFDLFLLYRERRHRNQRLAAGGVALVLVVAVIGSALALLRTSDERRPGAGGVVPIDPGINQACGSNDACWDADVFTMNVDGTHVTRLGLDAARDFGYSWSPDGQRIALYRGVGVDGGGRFDADWDILTMAADGSDVRRLTDDPALDLFPVYSPDGSKIAFTSDRAGTVDIWVMDADGSNLVQLTQFENDSLDDYHPTWSPDGEQIAFVRGKVPPGADGKLWVIDADGSNGHVLLDTPLVFFPRWSSDGTRIAFVTGDWPEVRVGVLDLATGTVTDVVAGNLPQWSPDSTRLLVSIIEGSGGFGIVDLDAPNRLQVLHDGVGGRLVPGWPAARLQRRSGRDRGRRRRGEPTPGSAPGEPWPGSPRAVSRSWWSVTTTRPCPRSRRSRRTWRPVMSASCWAGVRRRGPSTIRSTVLGSMSSGTTCPDRRRAGSSRSRWRSVRTTRACSGWVVDSPPSRGIKRASAPQVPLHGPGGDRCSPRASRVATSRRRSSPGRALSPPAGTRSSVEARSSSAPTERLVSALRTPAATARRARS